MCRTCGRESRFFFRLILMTKDVVNDLVVVFDLATAWCKEGYTPPGLRPRIGQVARAEARAPQTPAMARRRAPLSRRTREGG